MAQTTTILPNVETLIEISDEMLMQLAQHFCANEMWSENPIHINYMEFSLILNTQQLFQT